VVSLTGIYLSFPQTAREMMSSIAPMNPNQRGGFFGELARNPALTPDRALELALKQNRTPRRRRCSFRRGHAAKIRRWPAWRIQLARADGETVTVMVDDRSGRATPTPAPKSGDRAAS